MTQESKKPNEMTDFEKFIHDRGYEFTNEDALRAAYERHWKCRHDILITEDEFIAEACCRADRDENILKEVYATLSELVHSKKLDASAVYQYAQFGWCLRDAAAIIAYQIEPDKWAVNNCATVISEDAAKIAVNREWGFEASRIHIIGTPYYDATDWQFIRFDCGLMTWLWKSGKLYQVYW